MTGASTREVPVESLTRGDRVLLPSGKTVFVQRVDEHPDPRNADLPVLYVRWAAGQRLPNGHRLAGEPSELGSLKPLRPGDLVTIEEPL